MELQLGGQLIQAEATEALARELGAHLYEEVAVEGEATWNARTWEIENFRVLGVHPFAPSDPVSAFEQLQQASAGTWDRVDAREYVNAVRYGE
ncbi:hypothetical protein HZA57_00170 [Candidatus Poribacteria bacterium]|nr:hypothetical protein [Candidatus Poribacteria bacterium]